MKKEVKTMELRNKSKLSTIALTLILTISAILVILPSASAQETQTTYPFLGAVPNPVGRGQTVLFHLGIFQQLSSAKMSWEDLSITIKKPDGTTDTIPNINTDSTGGTGVTYTPTEVGTYTCQAHFPAQEITADKTAPGIPIGTLMLASDSAELELVVQEEAIPYYPDNPLPDQYWTRPIDAQLRSWHVVTGNWLEYRTDPIVLPGNEEAPDSAHILWAKELPTFGGIAGAPSSTVYSSITTAKTTDLVGSLLWTCVPEKNYGLKRFWITERFPLARTWYGEHTTIMLSMHTYG